MSVFIARQESLHSLRVTNLFSLQNVYSISEKYITILNEQIVLLIAEFKKISKIDPIKNR